jgi:hypothetical protein
MPGYPTLLVLRFIEVGLFWCVVLAILGCTSGGLRLMGILAYVIAASLDCMSHMMVIMVKELLLVLLVVNCCYAFVVLVLVPVGRTIQGIVLIFVG